LSASRKRKVTRVLESTVQVPANGLARTERVDRDHDE